VSTVAVAACENHPQREAIGVCVKCRTRVCSECSTKVDGINYCVRCLSGLARATGPTKSGAKERAVSRYGVYFATSGYFLLLSFGAFVLLQTLLPGR
jgi:hypothetical protein